MDEISVDVEAEDYEDRQQETGNLRVPMRLVQGEDYEDRQQETGNLRVPLLLRTKTIRDSAKQKRIHKAMNRTFKSTAHLANLLPTGTVLAFQLLAPSFTNHGQCEAMSRYMMTAALVALCGLSCILLSFTDSVIDGEGKVVYGFATLNGLWIIDGSVSLLPEVRAVYRLRFIDFLHAFMSVLVFAAVALSDQNLANCLYPNPSKQTKELLSSLPASISALSSMCFLVFPPQRHGIGCPITS